MNDNTYSLLCTGKPVLTGFTVISCLKWRIIGRPSIMAEWTFQKLRQIIYILGLAKNFYPKWLKVSEQAVGFSVRTHDYWWTTTLDLSVMGWTSSLLGQPANNVGPCIKKTNKQTKKDKKKTNIKKKKDFLSQRRETQTQSVTRLPFPGPTLTLCPTQTHKISTICNA